MSTSARIPRARRVALHAFQLLSLPVAVGGGYLAASDAEFPLVLRVFVHTFAGVLTFPLYWAYDAWAESRPERAALIELFGVTLRVMGLLVLGLALFRVWRAMLVPGVINYFINVGTFLIFRVVTQVFRK